MKVGDQVAWANPLTDGEKQERFVVAELNGDRCLIRFICDLPIPPTQVAMVAEIVVVKQG